MTSESEASHPRTHRALRVWANVREDARDDLATVPRGVLPTHCLTHPCRHPAPSEPSAAFRGMRCGHEGVKRVLAAGRGATQAEKVPASPWMACGAQCGGSPTQRRRTTRAPRPAGWSAQH